MWWFLFSRCKVTTNLLKFQIFDGRIVCFSICNAGMQGRRDICYFHFMEVVAKLQVAKWKDKRYWGIVAVIPKYPLTTWPERTIRSSSLSSKS